jgi:hypothetical protein
MARERGAAAERSWRERLARYRRCGETVADFCERKGVSTPSFYAWKRRLASDAANGPTAVRRAAALLVPLSLGAGTAGVRILLPRGDRRRTVCRPAPTNDWGSPSLCASVGRTFRRSGI